MDPQPPQPPTEEHPPDAPAASADPTPPEAPEPADAPDLLGPIPAGEPEFERAMRRAAMRAVVLAGFLVATAMLFHELVTLVAAGVITVILAILISSVAAPLERRGVPRLAGALCGLLLLGGVVAGLLALIVPPLVGQVKEFTESLPMIADDLSRQFASVTGGEPGTAGRRLERAMESVGNDPARFLGPLASIGAGVIGVLSALVVMVITAFYMAAHPRPLVDGVVRLFPPDRRDWASGVLERLRLAWSGWLKGVAVDMVVSGLLLYAGLSLIGLPFAGLFAALSALLVVVPYFGAIAGGIPPILFALAESSHLALLTLLVYLVVQQIEGNVIVPLVMSRVLELHPAVIAVGVVVVSQLFGLIGLLVAVPLCSAFVILVEEIWVRPLEHHCAPGPAPPEPLRRRGLAGRWVKSG